MAEIDVFIAGRAYKVACSREEESALVAAADYLDGKMREIREGSKVIGAAMNLEAKTIDCRFQRLNAKLGAPDRRTAVRIARLYGLL